MYENIKVTKAQIMQEIQITQILIVSITISYIFCALAYENSKLLLERLF